ncbi:MAG: hypothetical protein Pg6A_15770 [Termitinemataceae bacterium]|nr:MAG: hypothetical protein Pg6A_15770 [Termitinemataceae bacterium]
MASEYTVGPILEITLDGNVFQCANDGEGSGLKPKYTKEVIAGTKKNFVKYQRQDTSADNITPQVTREEGEILKALAERTDGYPISYKLASGDVATATGKIGFESINHSTGRVSGFKMIPDDDWIFI